jgi:tRNA(Ile)-lysidine synthase
VSDSGPLGAGATLVEAIKVSGLIGPGSSGLLLLSGGPDSSALAFGLAQLEPRPDFCALHLNYGLRPESGEDESAAGRLCERLGVEMFVERPVRPAGGSGNLHAWAREQRYSAAETLRARLGLDWIAVAHTASDLAETVIYRLAVSPGTRPLTAMPPRRGAVIRPLLALSREQVREAAEGAGLPFVDDRSNDDPSFARARIRSEVLPVLKDLNPAVLEAVSRTRDDLAEELDFLTAAGAELIEGDSSGERRIEGSRLTAVHPALRRFGLRLLAEEVLGRPVVFTRLQTAEVCRLVARPEGGRIDLGEGASMVAESGRVIVEPGTPARNQPAGPDHSGRDEPAGTEDAGHSKPAGLGHSGHPEPARLIVPGRLSWGGWEIRAEEMQPPFEAEGPGVATLDAESLGPGLEVRAWQEGDRISPLGLGGSKSLQDLFTDSGLPRSRRRTLPLVLTAGEVAWVPGLAIGERFRLTADTKRAIRLKASPARGLP